MTARVIYEPPTRVVFGGHDITEHVTDAVVKITADTTELSRAFAKLTRALLALPPATIAAVLRADDERARAGRRLLARKLGKRGRHR